MNIEKDETLKSGYQPRPVAPPSAGRALLVLGAMGVGLWLGLWLLWLKLADKSLMMSENEWWLWHNAQGLLSVYRSGWLWLTLAGNFVVYQWATRPLWQMAAGSRGVGHVLLLRLGLAVHGVSLLFWLLILLLLYSFQ